MRHSTLAKRAKNPPKMFTRHAKPSDGLRRCPLDSPVYARMGHEPPASIDCNGKPELDFPQRLSQPDDNRHSDSLASPEV